MLHYSLLTWSIIFGQIRGPLKRVQVLLYKDAQKCFSLVPRISPNYIVVKSVREGSQFMRSLTLCHLWNFSTAIPRTSDKPFCTSLYIDVRCFFQSHKSLTRQSLYIVLYDGLNGRKCLSLKQFRGLLPWSHSS